jgi:putative SOS response-associated peptidase YedK
MCGRFVQHADPEIYASRYDVDEIEPVAGKGGQGFNVAPTQDILAIRVTDDGRRVLLPLRWGLVPHWSKGPDNRYSMINARAESVHQRPAYRSAFRDRRCLIPTEGFYEWRAPPGDARGGRKQPYLIRRADGQPFTMAGLWETWRGEGEDGMIRSCTIVVTDANAVVAPIHDRMPVILAEDDHKQWLDPANHDTDALRRLLKPATPEGWTTHPVGTAVNNPRNDDPTLLEPIEPPNGEGRART